MLKKEQKDELFLEAVVMAVDLKRGVCKCRSRKGHYISNVIWAREIGQAREAGSNTGPVPGEVVYIVDMCGEKTIFASKGQLSNSAYIRSRINGSGADDSFEDEYNPGVASRVMRAGGSIPEDQFPGDFTRTNDRGGVLGLLRSGSFLAKVSPLAQLFISKFDDLVRVVSRNYEQFSDSAMDIQANLKGKLFRYTATFRTPITSREERPEYYEVLGDVETGEVARDNYLEEDISGVTAGNKVKKQVVAQYNVDGDEITPRWQQSLDLNGESLRGSYNAANSDSSVEELKNSSWRLTVTDSGGNSYIFTEPAKITLSSRGTTLVEMDGTSKKVTMHADDDILLDSGKTVVVNTKDATVNSETLTANCDTSTVNGTSVSVTATNITMTGLINMN